MILESLINDKNEKLPLTAFGDLRVAELSPIFQGSFEYTVDNTDLNINTSVNGATMSQASGMGIARTSTTIGSSQLFRTKQHARYKSGQGGLLRFTLLNTPGIAGTEQYIGLSDEIGSSSAFKNGYMLGFDGETFGYHRFQNDIKTTKPLSEWDDPLDGSGASGMDIDHTKLNVFFIQFQYLGAGAIKIWVEDERNGNLIVVHTELYANLNITPSVHNPNFFHTMWVNNGATTSDIIMQGSSYGFFVEGKTSFIELHQPENSSKNRQKLTVTSEVAIFTIRNKNSYVSKTNFIDVILVRAGASIEANSANNLGNVRIVKNATLGGTPSYSDINTTDSVIEIDTSGTTVTGGKEIFLESLAGKNDKLNIPILEDKIVLNPGDTITFSGFSVNSATINSHVSWRELF